MSEHTKVCPRCGDDEFLSEEMLHVWRPYDSSWESVDMREELVILCGRCGAIGVEIKEA